MSSIDSKRDTDRCVPGDVIPTILSWAHESIHELLADREGPLNGRYLVVDCYSRNGKDWLVLQSVEGEWCLEVEDSDQALAHVVVRALPPERARDYARTQP